MDRQYAAYLLASKRNGTLYVGVTNDLALRVYQHKSGKGSRFTARYRIATLVWYEYHADVNDAIAREKQIKKWNRKWKLQLIEEFNPDWADLYERLNQ
jgi:putative endonuclease